MVNLRFWRKRQYEPDEKDHVRDTVAEEMSRREAEQAVKHASETLETTRQQGQEVTRVSGSLKQVRERNHFADMIADSMVRRSH